MRDFDLATLRAFVTVARTGGMTAASRHLNLTQAAVSQQIKRLEDQLQLSLFNRSQRRITLTNAGERLLGRAEQLIAQNDDVWGAMTAPEFEGRIRLGVPEDVVQRVTPDILRSFSKAWPRVDIVMTTSSSLGLLKKLEDGEIDLTFTTEQHPTPESTMLLADRLVWVGAPDGCAHLRRPLRIGLGAETCTFRPAIIDSLVEAGIDWHLTQGCDSGMPALYAAIQADLTIAAMMSQMVPPMIEAITDPQELPVLPQFYLNLYRPKAGAIDLAEHFAQHIEAYYDARYPKAA